VNLPPTTTTTTLPPPSAHLKISPTSASLSEEATYDVGDTQTFFVTNDGNATSAPLVIDLDGLLNAYIDWRVPFDQCSARALAPGDTCAFNLEPHVKKDWPATTGPADLVVTDGAGASVTASISGTLTSDLQIPASNNPLFVTASAAGGGTGTTTFHIDNVSNQSVGPLEYTVAGRPGDVGTWSLQPSGGATPCAQDQAIPANSGCDWNLVYSNNTGTGSSVGVVTMDGTDGAHAGGAALGFGVP
jgi:hypothetical protein